MNLLDKKLALLAILPLAFSAMTWASPSSGHIDYSSASPSTIQVKNLIISSLKKEHSLKPFYDRLIRKYGERAVRPLVHIALNNRDRDETRWAALFALARLTGKHSLGVVRKLMSNSSWMLRDAALKTAAALDATELRPAIEKRLHDDALIVRTTAVQTIGHLKMKSSAPKLVKALFDPINYNHGKGLWIHKYILQVLDDFHYRAAVPNLVKLLASSHDRRLQTRIVHTLEDLTGKSFPGKSMQSQIYLWRRNTLSDMTF